MTSLTPFKNDLTVHEGVHLARTIEYRDPLQNFYGYLVYDRDDCRIAAGGCRVQPGLTSRTLRELAGMMTLKQRILGVNVDGAKCGINYDPNAPGMDAALGRFIGFLREELHGRLSMGCDMGTRWRQLERLARTVGVPSIKYSIKTAQSLSEPDFFARLKLLDKVVGPMTLGERRAGHALALVAHAAASRTISSTSGLTIALQGFGNLGRGAACAFAEWRSTVVAIADEHGCARDRAGLDLSRMLASSAGTPIQHFGTEHLDREEVLSTECDVLVLAAMENAVTLEQAARLPCRIVVVGANAGLSAEVEDLLVRRGLLVLPDFLGGIGGSASMEVLFGSERHLDPRCVLAKMELLISGLLDEVLTRSENNRETPRQAGVALAEVAVVDPDAPPYGSSPYSSRPCGSPTPGVNRGLAAVVPKSRRVPVNGSESCDHERAHIVDSRFYGHRYSTKNSRRTFCDHCRMQRWLDVEVALATTQAELGIIPSSAAEHIAKSAQVNKLNLEAVRQQIRFTGHSLVGLLRVFQDACPQGSGEYIHYGATTQDIQDTGQSLEMRDVLDSLEQSLKSILTTLAGLASAHRTTPALGRTHAQPALPMAFGLKIASWIDEVLRHVDRIQSMRPRVLTAQLFGGVGTMAGFGERGPELLARFADRLGLVTPAISWHVARDRVAEFVMTLAMVAASMARIADEVRLLSRPEFGEVEEGWTYGKVGSSTMPHKRNPEACEQVSVMATLAAAQVNTVLAAMRPDHERDSRALRVEWVCVADVSHYCLAACEILDTIVRDLIVHPDRLLANVRKVAEQVATENLMLALGRSIGKQTAHERIYELSQTARDTGQSLRQLVAADPDICETVPPEELDQIFDPVNYLGFSRELTEQMIARIGAQA